MESVVYVSTATTVVHITATAWFLGFELTTKRLRGTGGSLGPGASVRSNEQQPVAVTAKSGKVLDALN